MGITSDECVAPLMSLGKLQWCENRNVMLFSGLIWCNRTSDFDEESDHLGGWKDFEGFYNSVEEAKLELDLLYDNLSMQWAHIVEDGKITWQARYGSRSTSSGNPVGYWIWEKVKQCEI